ncbi:MAG: 4-hydroxy-tetrahydrodipicolinate reductase [Acidobacteriota bacterium]|jgi:4-hydroxy-tetrahydrodipicolinate reductase|nr:4-hydroxy-tetrahydrodipicolinate reductase [Acidobacteriota bacterium]
MKLALIGHGAMNRMVEILARQNGHEVSLVLTSSDGSRSIQELSARLAGHDVAIDFSIAAAVLKNAEACATAGVPLVEGTTGWKDHDQVRLIFEEKHGAFVYGANFSIGVNIFYRMVSYAAELFQTTKGYEPFIEEAHHSRKKDAPSGTALRLRDLVAERFGPAELSVASTRAGHIPGTHRVGFDGPADQIVLSHEARSREGFMAGALMAAGWIVGRRGVYEFSQVMDDILKKG